MQLIDLIYNLFWHVIGGISVSKESGHILAITIFVTSAFAFVSLVLAFVIAMQLFFQSRAGRY